MKYYRWMHTTLRWGLQGVVLLYDFRSYYKILLFDRFAVRIPKPRF